MRPLETILHRATADRKTIVFPEARDARVLRAVVRLASENIVEPVLVGSPTAVRTAAGAANVDVGEIRVEDPRDSRHRDSCFAAVEEAFRGKGPGADEVAQRLDDPLYFAAAMVRAGLADGSVAGAAHSTTETLRAALRVIRPAEGVETVSSFFLMELREPTKAGDSLLAFADCGLVPAPNPRELADIALRTGSSYRVLTGKRPKVALLSFSTKGSAPHAAADGVREATEILQAMEPGFPVDGELQLDAALVPEVARAKAPSSPLAGEANVLVFPDLGAGNIGYKLVERLAGARAIGPLLQGLARPANDLSRGCTEDDIVVAAAVTALQAGMKPEPQSIG